MVTRGGRLYQGKGESTQQRRNNKGPGCVHEGGACLSIGAASHPVALGQGAPACHENHSSAIPPRCARCQY